MIVSEKNYKSEIVLALGMFDSVHRGHSYLINQAKSLAESYGCKCGVFTFANNPYKFFGKNLDMVYTFEERLEILESLGVDVVIAKKMDDNYSVTSPEDFIKDIFDNFKIKAVVCGSDYTFGYKGRGNVELLKKFANLYNIEVKIVDFLKVLGKKISSSTIRDFVINGEIEKINEHLGREYSISGEVVSCFGRGKKYGYPTANLKITADKLYLKQGVYATTVEVDGVIYDSLTNIGIKPTFNDYSLTVESFILNFSGDLYGKEIKVRFYKKMRNITKFADKNELYRQIDIDINNAIKIKRSL